jgi:hypothetical protein
VSALGVLVFLLGCASSGGGANLKAELSAARDRKAKLAVISLTVNDYGRQLQGTSNSNVAALVDRKMDEMLGFAEKSFTDAGWTVAPAASLVGTEAYKKASIGKLFEGVYGPHPGGVEMLSFSQSRGDLVKTRLEPPVAQTLCAGLGVDVVVLVYSEWAVGTNSWTSLTSPLTKNVVGIYDSQGRQLFQARKDVKGDKVLGAFGRAVVDEQTMDVWVGAFENGLGQLIATM